jgi:predicted nucleic acid-binding protein
MKRTYLDSGVLIAAIRGVEPIAQKALEILDDPEREFVSSMFVKLEVLPKAMYHKQTIEQEFYTTFFDDVTLWAKNYRRIVQNAYQEACETGINALDALHVAAAASVHADELITTERPMKPIYRAKSVKVLFLLNTA